MKILFGVFDWGLGHATRDIPLIEGLLKDSHRVDIICTGRALTLLKAHFGKKCRYFDVPSIASPYKGKTSVFLFNFITMVPRMLWSLRRIRSLSKRIIDEGKYDKVISDCRYDVFDKFENSYLINHQLRFKSPFPAEIFTEAWLAFMMRPFKYILVPDFKEHDLSGRLSHGLNFVDKSKVRYMGMISAMKKKNVKKDIDYFVSLSGPEPQRTLLEGKILSSVQHLEGKVVIAGGNPDKEKDSGIRLPKNVRFHSFLAPQQQEDCMNRAKFVIIRAGYTTIMDLCELGISSALLIPAPGQTEQEYLADLYESRKEFHHQHQGKLDLPEGIGGSKGFKGFNPPWKTNESVRRFMGLIFK